MPFVRRPLALLICCGFAGAMLGPLASNAQAQGMNPLSVDPTLLGLPPAQPKPKAPPKPAEKPADSQAPTNDTAAPAQPRATVTPVASPEPVQSRPLATDNVQKPAPAAASAPQAEPARSSRAASPAPTNEPAAPASVSQPPAARASTPAAVTAAPVAAAVTAPVAATPARDTAKTAQATGSATPFRVDPALLGLPPATQVASPSAPARTTTSISSTPAPAVATTGAPQGNASAPVAAAAASAANKNPAASSGRQTRPPLAAPAAVLAMEPGPNDFRPEAPQAPIAAQPVAATTGTSKAGSSQSASSTAALGPLKVDPTLLGLPPLAAVPAPPQIVNAVSDPLADAEAAAPALPPRRRRGEDGTALAANTVPLPYTERDPGPALSLRRSRNTAPPPKNDDPHPTFLTARRIYGVSDHEAVLEGDAEMRRTNTTINADKLVYWQMEDEMEATGNVVYTQEGTTVTGPSMYMKMADSTGTFDQAAYSIHQERKVPVWGVLGNEQAKGTAISTGRGQSEKLEFMGENRLRLTNSTYTTCAPENNDWYTKTETLDLDYDRNIGTGTNGTVYFKDVPIFYAPEISFSLNNQRKSGFLAPTFGTNTQSGLMLTTPYYWNIAPNMDVTIAPRFMTKRGLQIGGEFRYLNYGYTGYARGEYVPSDPVRRLSDRYAVNIWHVQQFGNGFAGQLNLNKVSDDYFYTDLSSRLGVSAQTLMPRQGTLSYGSQWWNASVNVNRYQTLQPDPSNPIIAPYDVVPQLSLNARRPDYFGTDVGLMAQYTAFTHATKVTANRTVLYPQISLPLAHPSFYVTPKLGVHISQYTFGQQPVGTTENSYSRTVPILSLDSGVTFERETSLFGNTFTQTLEPRLYYVYIPYSDHSKLYNQNLTFDTGIADFNFGQIFAENRYVGQDYIGDANQLTAAATTRFLNPESGREYFRALIGQRYYFADQRVLLPGEKPRQHKNTNWLAGISGQILPKTYVDSALEYNPYEGRTDRFALTGRYQPEAGKVLNAGYRYTRDVLGNVDISGQWPLGRGWYGVGRYNFSLKEKRIVENTGGLEYNGGCWILRGVIQRYALTAKTSSTAFFLQLELNDFSQLGSNPLDMLRRTIPGYGRLNQPMADPVFGGIQ